MRARPKIFLGSLVMHGYIFFPVTWTTAPFWFFLPFGLWQSRRRRYISSGDVVDMLSPGERKLLERLADAGKILEDRGLLLVVRTRHPGKSRRSDSSARLDAATLYTIITLVD